jgi:vancomycin resistance protein YoaR
MPAVALVAACLAGAGLLIAFRATRAGTIPRLEVAGVSVGDMDEARLRSTVEDLAAERSEMQITLARGSLGGVAERTMTATPSQMGYAIDVDATVRELLGRGRQANPLAALLDHLRATFGAVSVHPRDSFDSTALSKWVNGAVGALTTPATEAGLEFRGTRVRSVEPAPGAMVDPVEVRKLVTEEARRPTGRTLQATPRVLAPRTTRAQLAGLLRDGRRAVSGPVTFRRGDASLELTPREIASVLRVDQVEEGGSLSVVLAADPRALEAVVGDRAAALETEPVNARFALGGGGVDIIRSRPGFRFDAAKAALQLVDAATSRRRVAKLAGVKVQPEFTTRDARALGITEQVSTFTTYYPCCQARVTNIHRIADIVRGTIVRPGEVFSMNQVVGQRTVANGFVEAPAIANGEFVEQIGGGISQFATTTFNAIFFGGYEILEHQAHSYYFTRYPMGREATVSWPSPDLRFRNNSNAGVYIWTSYTGTSISVSLFGNVDWSVESTTSDPYNLTEPPTKCKVNRDLAKGETRTVQTGSQGFDVTVKRIITDAGGRALEQSFVTRYKPQPIIMEQRNCGQ